MSNQNDYHNNYQLTHRDLIPESSCTINIGDESATFEDFIAIGINKEGEPTIAVCTDLKTVYNAAETLMEMYKKSIANAPADVQAEIEAELVIERSLLGEWEEGNDAC